MFESVRIKFFEWVLSTNISAVKWIIKHEFAHTIVPDLKTMIEIMDSENVPRRGAYFILLVQILRTKCNYSGKIIREEDYADFLDIAYKNQINISEEIKVLNEWTRHDYDNLLKTYLSLIIKISRFESYFQKKLNPRIDFSTSEQ